MDWVLYFVSDGNAKFASTKIGTLEILDFTPGNFFLLRLCFIYVNVLSYLQALTNQILSDVRSRTRVLNYLFVNVLPH